MALDPKKMERMEGFLSDLVELCNKHRMLIAYEPEMLKFLDDDKLYVTMFGAIEYGNTQLIIPLLEPIDWSKILNIGEPDDE